MYAQLPSFGSYQPSGYSQAGPWKVDVVYSGMTEDQCFVRQFEKNVLANKAQPIQVNTVKVRLVY